MKIAITLADTHVAQCAREYEGQTRPYRKRIVVIELTQDQLELIRPRVVGQIGLREVREEILDCFINWDERGS